MIPLLDLKAQYQQINAEIDSAISRVVSSSQFILGAEVEAFESEFASYCQTEHAVGVNSGTSALHLALLAAGVKPGDEVITVSYSFVATAAAICYIGAKPVFVDIDPRTCTLDGAQVERAITARTKIIMPVHLYGNCADMDPIGDVARRYNLIVIEDAAQAHGAEYRRRRAGSIGDMACFSFYPSKNLGAFGEAGAVVTKHARYAEQMRILRDHGQTQRYHHDVAGYNYRMEALQGAVLRVKLRHLDDWNDARRARAVAYRQLLEAEVGLLSETPNSRCVYHVFPIFTAHRDVLRQHLESAQVATGIHYPIPIHLQTGYQNLGYCAGDFPRTEKACSETLSLPIYPELTSDNVSYIANSIRQFSQKKGLAAD
ncbi:MAG TPA: DegT/DnrJ/EryC1/StrS family aminotransferase [Pyrinomonadaceae bacterium]|nr:DegT/DnrJ/EryC1/StrS family aminotransferase [Pyrinomonadaceae bacterium]